jgi:hypothetical protein
MGINMKCQLPNCDANHGAITHWKITDTVELFSDSSAFLIRDDEKKVFQGRVLEFIHTCLAGKDVRSSSYDQSGQIDTGNHCGLRLTLRTFYGLPRFSLVMVSQGHNVDVSVIMSCVLASYEIARSGRCSILHDGVPMRYRYEYTGRNP